MLAIYDLHPSPVGSITSARRMPLPGLIGKSLDSVTIMPNRATQAAPGAHLELDSRLSGRILDRSARIGIIGLGYVGLPLMLACSPKKFRVLGFAVDSPKVKGLNLGKSPLKHVPDYRIAAVRE